ncbi:MAG: MogA/MoaB family molybdenum cofactor biosynthesis protein [Clostridia bacterium]|nr:MogA/MoaB family molybdenum cofactor biosynthesis protein [Clostridia bacterium]
MLISVLTASDRCSRNICEDKSGPLISQMLCGTAKTVGYTVVPDEKEIIEKELIRFCDELHSDIVFTTGGTGFAPRDVTPEATKAVIEREAPGIPEAIRAFSMTKTPKAMLSRATAGIRGKTLIINLPGSPKAVKESLEVVMPVLQHAIETMSGCTISCGANAK